MKNANVTWTDDTLSKYLSDPKGFIPGDKMAFAGIKDPSRLGDLLAYLNQATKQAPLRVGPVAAQAAILHQCIIKTGTLAPCSTLWVKPPKTHSRNRLWRYAPMAICSAVRRRIFFGRSGWARSSCRVAASSAR